MLIIVRHKDINLIEEMCQYSTVPIINAMTYDNHPCEILSDLYALRKVRKDYLSLNYAFVGGKGNIGQSWVEASKLLGFNLTQVCPRGYEIETCENVSYDIKEVIKETDIVLTDPLPGDYTSFEPYRVSLDIMKKARPNALLNPCPPFFRGEEVTNDVIDSDYFVGYEFKKSLITVQQAIILFCLELKF